ncbi:MAG: hypothetical protein KGH66_01225 [Candidatus Micrarchaeota archaeon]|nr:hypothetical protein [Candidatus Micrarchaeota archaeon]
MFQEIEMLASIAAFLAFLGVFAYHLGYAQNYFYGEFSSHSALLAHGIQVQEAADLASTSLQTTSGVNAT